MSSQIKLIKMTNGVELTLALNEEIMIVAIVFFFIFTCCPSDISINSLGSKKVETHKI